jgi:hypothetical protein
MICLPEDMLARGILVIRGVGTDCPRPTGKESRLIPFQFGFKICLDPLPTFAPKTNNSYHLVCCIFKIVSTVNVRQKYHLIQPCPAEFRQ